MWPAERICFIMVISTQSTIKHVQHWNNIGNATGRRVQIMMRVLTSEHTHPSEQWADHWLYYVFDRWNLTKWFYKGNVLFNFAPHHSNNKVIILHLFHPKIKFSTPHWKEKHLFLFCFGIAENTYGWKRNWMRFPNFYEELHFWSINSFNTMYYVWWCLIVHHFLNTKENNHFITFDKNSIRMSRHRQKQWRPLFLLGSSRYS